MKVKNRAQLLKILKEQCAYDGEPTLKAVRAFLDENSDFIKLEFEGDTDLDSLWTKAVTLMVDSPEDVRLQPASGGEPDGAAAGDPEEEEDEPMARSVRDVPGSKAGAARTGKVHAAMHNGGNRKGSHVWHERLYQKRIKSGRANFESPDEATAFGAWVRAASLGSKWYGRMEDDRAILEAAGIDVKANVGYTNTSGGALIPDDFIPTLIDIRDRYNGVTQLATNRDMVRDSEQHPRITGDLTVYSPGEGSAITESNPAFDNVNLEAKTRATLTTVSNELLNDAAVSIADIISTNIVWSFEKDLEQAYVNGDGTTTYWGVDGLRPKLKGLSGTIANIAGLYVGTGNLYSELALVDFEGVQGRLPDLQSPSGDPVWLMHRRFYFEVAARLANAVGGITRAEISGSGELIDMFLGARVVFSNAMPRTEANSQVCALYGFFDLASMIGRVRGSMEIATSTDRYFEMNKWAIRGIHRAAVSVHDVGNANATEASRVPGPVVGLITAAS